MGISGGMGLINLFALQEEANLPTIYSSFQLLSASVLLVWVSVISSQRGERFARHWKGLAVVFLYLAVDESAKLHELSIMPVLHLIDGHATGILYWPWVIPGMMFVMFLAVIYLHLRNDRRACLYPRSACLHPEARGRASADDLLHSSRESRRAALSCQGSRAWCRGVIEAGRVGWRRAWNTPAAIIPR